MDGPAVHYNIGVAAYRSGDLARAERAFQEVARTPAMAALAHYNLGLVAVATRRVAQRPAMSSSARRAMPAMSDSPRSRRGASTNCRRSPHRSPGRCMRARGAGYDDNVALRSESIESSAQRRRRCVRRTAGLGQRFFRTGLAASTPRWRCWTTPSSTNSTRASCRSVRGADFRWDAWYLEPGGYGTQLTLGARRV